MSIKLEETKAVMTWPVGDYNEESDIVVTNDGIEIMDGYILIPWDWIDAARVKVCRELALLEKV